MKLIVPEYYDEFHCIADKCRHTCCAGWQIDIDDDTAALYLTLPGSIGERVRSGMNQDDDGAWHFVLDAAERCPMLTEQGLCSLISEMGEGALCQICDDHPRFRSFFSDRTEMGLGLCCEAAAALILNSKAPFCLTVLEDDGEEETPDAEEVELLALRDELLSLLTDRQLPLAQRIAAIRQMMDIPAGPGSEELQAYLLPLERLDNQWTAVLRLLTEEKAAPLLPEYDLPMEQLLATLLYRHLPGALEDGLAGARIAMCLMLQQLVQELFVRGEQTMARLTELVRLMSSQLEYSDENITALLEALS